MLQKNDLISLTITDITNEASGVGRHEGIAVFVPGTAVGDQLKVRIVKVEKLRIRHCRKYCKGIFRPD